MARGGKYSKNDVNHASLRKFVSERQRKVGIMDSCLGEQRPTSLSGETVAVSMPHRNVNHHSESGVERWLRFSDLKMALTSRAVVVVVAVGLVLSDLMVPCQSADSNYLLSMLEARYVCQSRSILRVQSHVAIISLFEPYVQIKSLRCLFFCWLLSGRSCDQVIETL